MERLPFVLRFGQETAQKPLSDAERETLLQTLAAAGAENFSIWQIEDFWFCYGEYSELRGAEAAAQALCAVAGAELFAAPGTLPPRLNSFIVQTAYLEGKQLVSVGYGSEAERNC